MLYNEFERFTFEPGESIHSYYSRFTKLINDMRMIPITMSPMQIDTKFVNHLQPEWSRGGYRAVALGFYQRNNANPSYQERRQSMEETLSKFMSESAKKHEKNSNMIKEIQASTDTAIRNQGSSIKTLEIQIGKMRKDKSEYKGNHVVEALTNIPIFLGTFSVLIDFAVLKDMDAYRDEGMGDVTFGKLFLREVWINARRFEGMITIYKSSGLVRNPAASTSAKPPTKNDWDFLFQQMFDEYFKSPSAVSTPISAETLLPSDIARASSSTTIDQ
uniref:Integrase, catalytic region, zinc finger, CCHC-type, peptidase aspartic, catalytic n=1 Tax=Tanacetum cinerariifolium TaxID=118510 RepID=A0A6L2NPE9_TANCI|nr:integrase, catalytic region, zinc finger, CCHC-type, peptidase aspartic, catalytic [Tanacetum cinerariifolium]